MASGLDLSERQRNTLAAALTILAAFVIAATIAAVLVAIGWFFARFSAVFLPLAVAGILALLLRPYYEFLHVRWKLPGPLALVVVFLSILVPLVGFFVLFGAVLFDQIVDLARSMPGYWQNAVDFVQQRWPQVHDFFEESEYGRMLRDAFQGHSAELTQGLQRVGGQALQFGGRVLGWVGALLAWAVLPVYLGFFLIAEPIKAQDLEDILPFLKSETRKDVVYLVKQFIDIMVAFFRGQIVVAFLQGVLFALGFSLVGLRYGLVLGLALGFLNIIPYLGSIVGLAVALPLALFQQGGGWWLVAAVLVVFTVVQMIEGYLLTPRIMGNRTGLHPMAIIVAVFFWGSALNGIAGMILAIPLTAFLVVFWRLLREKYIEELV